MAKLFEFPSGGEAPGHREIPEIEGERESEMERPWPLINPEEDNFIENMGGRYVGYVEATAGRPRFQDLVADHVAYYDQAERAVIEAFVATEGVNNEGINELSGPSEIAGFTLMIVRRSRQGQEIDRPLFFSIQTKDFPGEQVSANELRHIAHAAHELVLRDVKRVPPAAVCDNVETYLHSRGWQHSNAARNPEDTFTEGGQ
jgi:hypothetical protein